MPNEVLVKSGTAILWADTTDYSPTAARTLGARTDQIDVTDLGAGAAREGAKVDLGATRAAAYAVDINFEPATDPTAGDTIDIYWSPSHSTTANVGNIGGVTGADAAFTGYSGSTLAEALANMQFVGSAAVNVANDVDGVQSIHVGTFVPTQRYGTPVVFNNMAVALHSDAVEFALRFTPIIDEVQ